MADVVIAPSPAPSTAPYAFAPAGGDVRVAQSVQIAPTVSQGPTVGSFGSFLLGGAGMLAGLASLASAFFPGAAPIIQQVAGALGNIFGSPVAPPPPAAPSVSAGTVPGIGPTYAAPPQMLATIPFDETGLLTATPAALTIPVGGTALMQLGGQLLMRALPAIEAVVPRIIQRAPQLAALGAAIYAAYQSFRAQGLTHQQAKKKARESQGVFIRRRRMRVTNAKALRRALRRARGFQRVARKVGALHVGGRRAHFLAPRRRRRRVYRGDVPPWMVEDWEDFEDMADEAEDDGYDRPGFRGDEVYAE